MLQADAHVPVHATTREVLLDYAARRDEHPDRRGSPYFFVTERGRRLLMQYVHPVFWKVSRQIGLRSREAREAVSHDVVSEA